MSRYMGSETRPESPDHVDQVVAAWRRERPDLDPSPMGVIGRVSRLYHHLQQQYLEPNFAAFGLKSGEFDVLATLRRAGSPHCLSPTALYQTLMITSGTMTHRLDRLEAAGLIARRPDPDDRRGSLVALTESGLMLVDRVVEAHLETERRALAGLTPEQQQTLADLMRVWQKALGA